MKIAFVNNVAQMGGAQKVTLDIVRSLPCDWEIHVIAGDCQDNLEFVSEFSKAGAKPLLLKELKREICISDIKAFFKLYSLFLNNKYDIVHTNSTKPGIVARIAARFAGVKKIIHTVHGVAFNASVNPAKRIMFYTLEIIATFFGHKLVLVNKLYNKYYSFFVSKDNIKTIYNGFNRIELVSDDYQKKVKSSGSVNILFMARFDEAKDPLNLIKAVEILIGRGCGDVSLTLAGDGPLLLDCINYVNNKNICSYVKFSGWADANQKRMLYSDADIFCVPSIYEAFGLVFLEAASFELPVVSTSVGGIPEVVKHDETGLLVEPKNELILADALQLLCDNIELRKKLGRAGREYVHEMFPIDKMTNSYMDLYDEK